MPQAKPQKDIPGYLLSIVTFLAGIGLLAWAFWSAYKLFNAPVAPIGPNSAAMNIGASLAAFVEKLLVLLVMTGAASIMASQGVSMYHVASRWAESHAATRQTTTTESAEKPAVEPKTKPASEQG